MARRGEGDSSAESEWEQKRISQLRALVVTQIVLQDVGIEEMDGISIMTREEHEVSTAIAEDIRELGFDSDYERSVRTTVASEVENGVQVLHYQTALATIQTLAEQNEHLPASGLEGIQATIEAKLRAAEDRERFTVLAREDFQGNFREEPARDTRDDLPILETPKARRRIFPKAKTIFKDPLAALAIASVIGSGAGLGTSLHYTADQKALPLYASALGRTQMTSELEGAAIDLEWIPASTIQSFDGNKVVSTVTEPARYPDSNLAWHALDNVQAQLRGQGPGIETRTATLKTLKSKLFDPPVSTAEAFAQTRMAISVFERGIPALANSDASVAYGRDSVMSNGSLAASYGGLMGLGVAGILGYRRTRNRVKNML